MMDLQDILECLEDSYQTAELGAFQTDVVPAALAQDLILKAANLHKQVWINSEERLPEIEEYGFSSYSKDVLIYEAGNYRVAYLCFKEGNLPRSGYRWIYDDYDLSLIHI